MSTFTLPNDLEKYLFLEGKDWNIYLYQNHYIKMLQNLDEKDIREPIQIILKTLQKRKYEHPQIAKVEEIYYDSQNQFIGYCPETKEGNNLYWILEKSDKPLEEFYNVAKSLLNIIKFAQKKQIVLNDIITEGNLLYEPHKKTVNLIDVDSLQIPESTMTMIHTDLTFFIYQEGSRNHQKYLQKERLQSEFNILSFYEIMFRGIFQDTLLDIYRYSKRFHKKDLLQRKLNDLGFDSKTDLYERILDLVDENAANTISLDDFEYLITHYKYDKKRKKLID